MEPGEWIGVFVVWFRKQILAGRIAGFPGDAIMIPSSGQLRANNVLLVGLGPRAPYRLGEVADAVSDVIARAVRLACPSLAMTPLGLAEDEFPRCAEAFVEGAAAGFAQSETSLRLRVILPPAEINRATESIDAAIADRGPKCFRFKRPSLDERVHATEPSRARIAEAYDPLTNRNSLSRRDGRMPAADFSLALFGRFRAWDLHGQLH